MSARLAAILVVLLVILGGGALLYQYQERTQRPANSDVLGRPLLKDLKAAEVASIRIVGPKATLTVRQKEERWVLAERGDFPADVAKVRDFVVQALSLKVGQSEPIGDKDRARLNLDESGTQVEFGGAEYMVRGRGYAKSIPDLENIVVGRDDKGTPILVKNLGTVSLGPDIRRGVADFNGEGDTVGGIVIMRAGENALNVIDRVKTKVAELEPSFPKGLKLVPTYDRSVLIRHSIDTLKEELLVEVFIVSLVILIFLWHIPSAIVPILTIPISVVIAFIPMYLMGLTSNIMSLTGIAISIGVLVDGAIVEVENAYKRLEQWIEGGRQGDFHEIRLRALKEVGPSVFFSLLVIAVAFMPVFTLVDQEGRLFKPLAYTKNLAMAIAALLAITLDPAIRMMFTRMDYLNFRPRWLSSIFNRVTVGRYYPEEKHPISRILFWAYEPACNFVLRHKGLTIVAAVLLVVTTIPIYLQLGSEFMPPLYEGSILYMPTTMPGLSVTEAQKLLQTMDQQLKAFPEVETVFGKAGRAESSTDRGSPHPNPGRR